MGWRGHTGSNFGTFKAFPGQSKLFRDNLGKSRFSGPFRDTGKKSGTVPEIPGQLATMLKSHTLDLQSPTLSHFDDS